MHELDEDEVLDHGEHNGESSNSGINDEAEDRRVILDEVQTCKTDAHHKARRRSRYSTFIDGISQFDPNQELTATQIAAFRQVFDMADTAGSDSICTEELYLSMKDSESGLKAEEIKDILDELDRDGSGEINFQQFLYMMTSMSLQIKEAQDAAAAVRYGKRKQTIFFPVITKFATRHSLKEIERYYDSRERYDPHVVSHYAAGARSFGLTDQEMLKTWNKLSHASKGRNSPYAQPLNFVDCHYRKCKNNTPRRNSVTSSSTDSNTPSLTTTDTKNSLTNVYTEKPNIAHAVIRHKIGWTTRHRLPITEVKLPKFNLNKNKELRGKKLDVTNKKTIQRQATEAQNTYYTSLHKENEGKSQECWDSLKINEMPSGRLQTNFKKVFQAYSPTKVEHCCNVQKKVSTAKLKMEDNKSHVVLTE